MTIEEAIEYWDGLRKTFSSRLEKEENCFGRMHFQTTIDVLDITLACLREQEERRWIPVTERLPKLIPCRAGTAYSESVNVLTSDRKVITAIYDGTDWIGPFGFWDAEDEEITHWAPVLLPLPEPLEDGTV